jgi:hypothetical protein
MPNVPLRLLDCFGLDTPVCFFVVLADLGAVEGLRFGGGGGSGAGLITGEERNADGDGIVIVSILITSCGDTSALAQTETLNAILLEWRWRWAAGIKSTSSRSISEDVEVAWEQLMLGCLEWDAA